MKILLGVEHFPTVFKPYLDDMFVSMAEAGHDVTILAHGTFGSSVPARVRENRLHERVIYYPTTLRTVPRHAPRALSKFVGAPLRSARRFRAAAAYGRSLKQGLLHGQRSVLLPDARPDLIMLHNTPTLSFLPFLGAVYPHSPVGFYYHGGEVAGTPKVEDDYLYRAPDLVLTGTGSAKGELLERGARESDIVLCPIGFDLRDFPDPVGRSYRQAGTLHALFAGRISTEKGLDVALQAIAALAAEGLQVRLTVAGGGPQAAEARQIVVDLGLAEQVHFAGYLGRPQLADALRTADVLLLPSIPTATWKENQGCIMQEAMTMRVPVIASDLGGIGESLPDVMARLMVEPGNAEQLATRLREYAALADADIARLGDIGRAFVVEGYDVRVQTGKLLDAILARGTSRRTA